MVTLTRVNRGQLAGSDSPMVTLTRVNRGLTSPMVTSGIDLPDGNTRHVRTGASSLLDRLPDGSTCASDNSPWDCSPLVACASERSTFDVRTYGVQLAGGHAGGQSRDGEWGGAIGDSALPRLPRGPRPASGLAVPRRDRVGVALTSDRLT